MRALLKHIILFLLPFLIGIALLFIFPLNKKFAYNYVKGECNNKASWIYNRVFENPRNIDIVFSGASHTACAIMDEHIEKELRKQTRKEVNVANIAYCRGGRDIQYVMLKDLFEQKQPKILVIDVTEDEPKKSHPVFPYLANTKDLFGSAVLFNQRYISSLFKGVAIRFEQLRAKLYFTPQVNSSYSDYGYLENTHVVSHEAIAQNKMAWERRLSKNQSDFLRNVELNYSKHYLQKIAQLAEINNCQILFLYLPESGSGLSTPLLIDFYSELGPVILPNKSTFANQKNWMDATHFNDSGAKEVSKLLTEMLILHLNIKN